MGVRDTSSTPAATAAQCSRPAVIRKLCPTPGDREEARGRLQDAPLLAAARRGGALATLIAESADVDHATPEGCTALTLAAENGHAAVIRTLAAAQLRCRPGLHRPRRTRP